MYKYYNPNPLGKKIGDCVIRAISKILSKSWYEVYLDIAMVGLKMCDMPSSNAVWGAYLYDQGFKRAVIDNTCPNCYTVKDFCHDNSKGLFLLATGEHVVAIIDGDYYDSWDSGDEIPVYYWFSNI